LNLLRSLGINSQPGGTNPCNRFLGSLNVSKLLAEEQLTCNKPIESYTCTLYSINREKYDDDQQYAIISIEKIIVLHSFRGAPKNSITSRSSYFVLDLHIQTKKGPNLMTQSLGMSSLKFCSRFTYIIYCIVDEKITIVIFVGISFKTHSLSLFCALFLSPAVLYKRHSSYLN
jgi:hypothetical protein